MKLKRQLTDFRKLNGGHRPNSGRKPKLDKLVQIRFSVPQSVVDKIGSIKEVSGVAKALIDELYGD